MSASELFDLLRPIITIISAIVSACVLFSARKRFPLFLSFLWAIATFFFPLIILPLFLVTLILWKRAPLEIKHRFKIPLLYLASILAIFLTYTLIGRRSVDSHLSRAAFARVRSDKTTAIKEYREALRLEDSGHNHKLLAAALEEAGLYADAINEFRAAQRGGEPDDTIDFRLAILLEQTDKKAEALNEFKKFLMSETCSQVDERCTSARERIAAAER